MSSIYNMFRPSWLKISRFVGNKLVVAVTTVDYIINEKEYIRACSDY